MATISKKRQRELTADGPQVNQIYEAACQQWGTEAVAADPTRIWDLRCIWGMKNVIPFGSLVSGNLAEVLWVAENVCGVIQPRA